MSVWTQKASAREEFIVKCRCRPTMRTKPPFYSLFVGLTHNVDLEEWTIDKGLCTCPTGLSRSCVHVTALLLSVIEVGAAACTSLPCLWKRPSGQAKGMTTEKMVWPSKGKGYSKYTGPLADPRSLLQAVDSLPGGEDSSAVEYFRHFQNDESTNSTISLQDPIDILRSLAENQGYDSLTVEDVATSLQLNEVERKVIELSTRGQSRSTTWLQARQWRVTSSKFGCICNRPNRRGGYPASMVKGILGDYGNVHSTSLDYGRDTEGVARLVYESVTGNIVEECGLFVHQTHNFLGASPDGIISSVINTICCLFIYHRINFL